MWPFEGRDVCFSGAVASTGAAFPRVETSAFLAIGQPAPEAVAATGVAFSRIETSASLNSSPEAVASTGAAFPRVEREVCVFGQLH